MIISNGKKVVAYNGDYKPVNVYSGRKKVAGYVTDDFEGKRIEVEDTYNDVLDVAVQGQHEQRSEKAVWWNQMVGGDITLNDTHKYAVKYADGGSEVVLGSDFSITEEVIQVTDITAMFGAGHEPTAEQFRKMFQLDYYPYCEGEWRYAPDEADSAFMTPMPDLPEEVVAVENPKVEVSSKGVMWNQIVKNGDFATQTGWKAYNSNNSQISITGNTLVHTMKTAGTGGYQHGLASTSYISPYPVKGTKFLISYEVKPSKTVDMGFDVCNTTQSKSISCEAGVWSRCMFRLSAAGTSVGINIIVRSETSVGDTFIYRNVNLFNLTAMFGAGNEPTLEEFRAMFPKDYYPYDSGTLRTIKGLHPIVPTTVTIPFNLYGANGINDECEPCVLVDGEWKCRVTRRWKTRKLISSLNWSKQGSGLFSAYVSDINKTLSYGAKAPLYCSHLQIGTVAYNEGDFNNDRLFQYIKTTDIRYRNVGRFEDINDFKNKLKDAELLYRLETPVIELYDPIPVRTLPINTIVDCDAEMRARIKRVDNA